MSVHQAENVTPRAPAATGRSAACRRRLAARLEPFNSYWQAPADVDAGYAKFAAYYRANYLPHLPADRHARILVVSCGPGYLVDLLRDAGYRDVRGIDSDPEKVAHARRRGLPCETAEAFPFLEQNREPFDVIIPEQELNHLTLDEQLEFLSLCRRNLKPGGLMIVYGLNGANPLVGSENLAHNIDHFNTFTDYSLQADPAARRVQRHQGDAAEALCILEKPAQLCRARGDHRARAVLPRLLHPLRQGREGPDQEARGGLPAPR